MPFRLGGFSTNWGLKPGQWNCDACLTPNNADVNNCAACCGPRDPKAAPVQSAAPVTLPSTDAFGGTTKGPVFKFDTSKTSAGTHNRHKICMFFISNYHLPSIKFILKWLNPLF